MKTNRLSIALCWALVLSLASGQPNLFTLPELIVFGDSLSDTGNMLALFNGSFPPPVYWQGRFTNSPGAWVDQVKNAVTTVPDILFPTVTNYAYGGATACYYPNITGKQAIIPSMRQMVQRYLSQPIKPGKKVIVLWGGHNDIMSVAKLPNKNQILAVPPQIIACITDMAGKLARADKDATVLIASLAPLQLTPYLKILPIAAKLINTLNKGLHNGARLQGLLTKGRVAYWDINTLLANSINKVDPLVFPKGASKPCMVYKIAFDGFFKNLSAKPDSVCTDPDNYVFYDPVHPSARAQAVIARAYFNRLAELKLVESALNFMLNARINV